MENTQFQLKKHSGFTLIEVLIVVVIIGVLASIAIPVYRNYITVSKQKSAEAVLEQLPLLLEAYRAENGSFPPNGTTTYSETASGGIASQTIKTTAGLTGFTPRTGTTSGAISFDYSLTITGSGATGESATFTATGVRDAVGIVVNGSYQ